MNSTNCPTCGAPSPNTESTIAALQLRAVVALLQDYDWSMHRQPNGYWVRIWNPARPTPGDRPLNEQFVDSAVCPTLEKAILDVCGKLTR